MGPTGVGTTKDPRSTCVVSNIQVINLWGRLIFIRGLSGKYAAMPDDPTQALMAATLFRTDPMYLKYFRNNCVGLQKVLTATIL